MKINCLTRVIVVILVLSMLPLWMLGCGKSTSRVSDKLVEMMIGDGKLSEKSEESLEYIASLDAEVEYLKTYFSTEGYWDKQWLEPDSSYPGIHYSNIYKCTVAWATKGSEHYHSHKVMSIIKKALEYGSEELYTLDDVNLDDDEMEYKDSQYTVDERSDVAESLVRTMLILRDKNKISKRKMENYIAPVIGRFVTPVGTGVKLARSAYIVVASRALIGEEELIKDSVGVLSASAVNVTNGSGLYADGSFVSDDKVAANGSYGVIAFSEMVEIAYAVQGEAYDFAAELKVPEYLYNWAINSIVPSIYNGRAFASGAASYLKDTEELGGRAASSMLALAKYFEETGDAAKATELRSIVKGYGESPNSDFNAYLTTFGATEYEDIVKDKDITAKTVNGAFNFAKIDRLNIIGTAYSASLSLSSYRTAKYETRYNRLIVDEDDEEEQTSENAVNGKGWYTGDGMLMIYTTEYAPGSSYWKYVKGTRIPGTTVDSRDRKDTMSDGYTGSVYNSGSVVNGNIAVSAYHFINNNSELTSVGLTAKKSWFFLDGEIVALGAGISNPKDLFASTGYAIETVVENVYVGNYTSICTSALQSGDKTLAKNKVEEAPEAFFILGYGGIYVPKAKNDVLKYSLSETEGGNFIEVWLDHSDYVYNAESGFNEPISEVSDKSYEYVIIPSTAMNMNDFFAYTQTPGYKVLSNTEQVQAVADVSSGVEGYVFWEAASCANAAGTREVSADFACNVIIKETDTQITVTVADITQTTSTTPGNINIGVTGTVDSASSSAGITLNGTTVTVDRTVAASGQSLTIVINK
ncbi:MAG: hypothetical protein IKB51_00955 [Clostridia bacterium]|nr:hypothetical protein [Clostridia bacterium]